MFLYRTILKTMYCNIIAVFAILMLPTLTLRWCKIICKFIYLYIHHVYEISEQINHCEKMAQQLFYEQVFYWSSLKQGISKFTQSRSMAADQKRVGK